MKVGETLSNRCQHFLRVVGLISDQEVVYRFGDLFIAENPVTGAKRQIKKITEHFGENNKSESNEGG